MMLNIRGKIKKLYNKEVYEGWKGKYRIILIYFLKQKEDFNLNMTFN